MKILLLTLCCALPLCALYSPFIVRTYARRIADQITYAHRPATEKHISRYISVLTWCNDWITEDTLEDQKRIDRLRDMLKQRQNPHG